ncbi:MAG: hypothetical protein R3E79_11710 [Caldilineaceae bacterium]
MLHEYCVYGDALADQWQEWSWEHYDQYSHATGTTVTALAVTYDGGWAALHLHSTVLLKTKEYDAPRFWLHGGRTGGQTDTQSCAGR